MLCIRALERQQVFNLFFYKIFIFRVASLACRAGMHGDGLMIKLALKLIADSHLCCGFFSEQALSFYRALS
jgi:hypothetical protein